MSRFILGNCIDVMRGFPDRAVDLIVTDPPYLVCFKGNGERGPRHQNSGVTARSVRGGGPSLVSLPAQEN